MELKKIYIRELSVNSYVKINTKEQFNKIAPYIRGKLKLYDESVTLPIYVSPTINYQKVKSFGIEENISKLNEVKFEQLKFSKYVS